MSQSNAALAPTHRWSGPLRGKVAIAVATAIATAAVTYLLSAGAYGATQKEQRADIDRHETMLQQKADRARVDETIKGWADSNERQIRELKEDNTKAHDAITLKLDRLLFEFRKSR